MRGELDLLFNPKTIAVVGASNTPGKVGHILMSKLENFKGTVIPINRNDLVIHKREAHKKLTDYTGKIDLAIIATPKKTVLKILKDVKKKQIKNVIIITAGFGEIGDHKAEEKIKNFAKGNKINIIGPNCFGITNAEKNIDLTFSKETPEDGDTVFISQSGALGSYAMDLHIKLRAFISLGNMSDITFSDMIEYWSHDKKTKKIILYIERLKEGKKFIDVCKKSDKEIIVVKSGKTETGQKATMSHTGSLATNFEIYKGAFRQARVKYFESLTKALGQKKETIINSLKGKNIAIITNAGGAGALLTDELEREGYKVFGPKDILGTATPNDYKRALNKIRNPYSNIVVVFTPQTMSDAQGVAKVISMSRWKDKIIAILLGEKSVKEAKKILKENNVPVFTKAV